MEMKMLHPLQFTNSFKLVFMAQSLLILILSCSPSHIVESRFTETASFIEAATIFGAHEGTIMNNTANNHGTKRAILVAGSNGYDNYRHQADICHAYQILKRGGLKDEHIVVFMYDDIANHPRNPRKGTLFNHPKGSDVYKGVPKDYTGKNVTTNNLVAVILGDKNKVKGGSKKVVNSGPKDNIFIYYADHGTEKYLGMPNEPNLRPDELVDVLKKKHDSKSYNRMVIYVEACFAGRMFRRLPKGLNIYVNTASNSNERSQAIYCTELDPTVPKEFNTCLGDLYSVSWMEDSDMHEHRTQTLKAKYEVVKKRTNTSHVRKYGDYERMCKDLVSDYLGFSLSAQ